MEHNDATDKDLVDPDATEVVSVDLEAMLHMELDAERASRAKIPARLPSPRPAAGRPPKESLATVRAMRAAPRVGRMSSARMPVAGPRPPIHTLLPPRRGDDYEEDTTTHQMPRVAAGSLQARASKPSVRASVPSVKSVAFPPPSFNMPAAPKPFHTVPAIPTAKRSATVPPPADSGRAGDSQATSFAPLMAPTSRRDISLDIPKAMESLAPMAMSAFPSNAPPMIKAKLSASAIFAMVFTLVFALGSVAVIALGVFKPSAIERGRIAVVGAMKGNPKHVKPAPPPPAAVDLPTSVPPVLLEETNANANAHDAGAK